VLDARPLAKALTVFRNVHLKKIISLAFLFLSTSIYAGESDEVSSNKLANPNNSHIGKISEGEKELKDLQVLELQLSSNMEKTNDFKDDLQEVTMKLLELTKKYQEGEEPLKIRLLQPTNLYIFVLPLVTIFIVIGSAFISLRTIKIKSQESLDALENSNNNQTLIGKNNNEFERLKSQEIIVSNSRQQWINALRDELSSLISHLTEYRFVNSDRQFQIFSKVWAELYKIELLLNPTEDLHEKMIKELREIVWLCHGNDQTSNFMEKREVVLSLSKEILKQEWRRVKSFD
jgi:hypothetical protein